MSKFAVAFAWLLLRSILRRIILLVYHTISAIASDLALVVDCAHLISPSIVLCWLNCLSVFNYLRYSCCYCNNLEFTKTVSLNRQRWRKYNPPTDLSTLLRLPYSASTTIWSVQSMTAVSLSWYC